MFLNQKIENDFQKDVYVGFAMYTSAKWTSFKNEWIIMKMDEFHCYYRNIILSRRGRPYDSFSVCSLLYAITQKMSDFGDCQSLQNIKHLTVSVGFELRSTCGTDFMSIENKTTISETLGILGKILASSMFHNQFYHETIIRTMRNNLYYSFMVLHIYVYVSIYVFSVFVMS